MVKRMLFVMLLVTLGFTLPAAAQVGSGSHLQPFQNDVVDPCPTYDSCTMYITTTSPWTGGPVTYPAACKQGGCRTCDNIDRCRTVYLDAYCACTDEPVPGAGPHITSCAGMYGDCVSR